MKKVAVSVTNDLASDQRVLRSIGVLRQMGFAPVFIGRKLPHSPLVDFAFPHKRFRLWFHRGFLFYAHYNLRLFWHLLTHRYDIYLSNDLDTLLPNVLIAGWRNKPLIYDAHEYFTGVPEIQHRPLVKWVWTRLERWLLPRAHHVVTVNESIADLYRQEYQCPVRVVRNISDSRLPAVRKSRKALGLPEKAFILINQGAGINVDRGMEEALQALSELPQEIVLLIVGQGDAVPQLKRLAEKLELHARVIFVPRQPYLEMLQYTLNADAGLSLDKPHSPNYRFSLPNKIFDYFKCGLPVIVSPVVEVRKLVEEYAVGEVIRSHRPADIAAAVLAVRQKGRDTYTSGLARATAENNWEVEKRVWQEIFELYR